MVGVVPALAASRTNIETVLRGVRVSQGLGGRRVLVIVQMALCTLLLAGAGLLVRTFQHLESLDPGFDRTHVVTFTTDPALAGYTEAQEKSLWQDLTARVRDIPGVVQVASSSRPIMRGSGMKTTIAATGRTVPASEFLNTSTNSVSLDYFNTMGIRLVAGRPFATTDITEHKPIPAIVNESFAQRTFPEGNPVSRTFGYGIGKPAQADFQVIGVVRDAKYRSLREPMTPTFYTARNDGFAVMAVRTNRATEFVIQPVRQALAAIDPALPFTEIHTLTEEVETSAAPERLTASLASCFGIFAALLAAAGIYGLMAFAVEQRRREFGIRMALGARPSDIGGMLARQTAGMAAVGLTAGLAAALLFGRWLRTLLYGVAPTDPVSLIIAVALVLIVSAAATAIPAGRAAQVEPATALRLE
jgi:predicted permease